MKDPGTVFRRGLDGGSDVASPSGDCSGSRRMVQFRLRNRVYSHDQHAEVTVAPFYRGPQRELPC